MMLEDLKEKKEELDTSYIASEEYLRKQKIRSQEEFDETAKKEMLDRVEKFRKQLVSQKL